SARPVPATGFTITEIMECTFLFQVPNILPFSVAIVKKFIIQAPAGSKSLETLKKSELPS
ncbi:MAG TPA: hypothetical protein PLP25_12125, partial [Candidatus Limiplasma sp.]|nr:hypothetical protein [Candidatus Limiplasma sp.]